MGIKNKNRSGFRHIAWSTLAEIARKPICWIGFFLLPLFCFLFLTSEMEEGLPTRVPAAVVDKDGSSMSRQVTQNLAGMQMVDMTETPESFTAARHDMQEGKIFGFFFIPENFQADVLAGRSPVITFYTNMTYFVPASLLFKTFKTSALYSKAGIAVSVLDQAGASGDASAMLMPMTIISHPIGNPWLNYGIYLANSFVPCVLQLMILLMTCYTLGQEIKQRRSRRLLQIADGSIVKAVTAKLLPQTIIWWVTALFMTAWLYKYNHYPMNGSWMWMILSELMYVLACQGFALFIFGVFPNLRLSLSVSALLGILSFSIAAFSFPVESMYPAIGIFSWIVPVRYNFLIYLNEALNGLDVYYSRIWFAVYIVFMVLPFTLLWRVKRAYRQEVYVP